MEFYVPAGVLVWVLGIGLAVAVSLYVIVIVVTAQHLDDKVGVRGASIPAMMTLAFLWPLTWTVALLAWFVRTCSRLTEK